MPEVACLLSSSSIVIFAFAGFNIAAVSAEDRATLKAVESATIILSRMGMSTV